MAGARQWLSSLRSWSQRSRCERMWWFPIHEPMRSCFGCSTKNEGRSALAGLPILLDHRSCLDGKFVFDAAAIFHGREWLLGLEDLEAEEQTRRGSGEAGDEQEK